MSNTNEICYHCKKATPDDDLWTVVTVEYDRDTAEDCDTNVYYCNSCKEKYTFECFECAGLLALEAPHVIYGDGRLCMECYSEGFLECDNCGRVISYDESETDDGDSFYCNLCYKKIKDEEEGRGKTCKNN